MANTIWVVNHSGHNIIPAVRTYKPDSVQYLTEGNIQLEYVDRIKFLMWHGQDGKPGLNQFDHQTDMLLLCGNTVLNVIAAMLLYGKKRCPSVQILIWEANRKEYTKKDLSPLGIDKLLPEDLAQIINP